MQVTAKAETLSEVEIRERKLLRQKIGTLNSRGGDRGYHKRPGRQSRLRKSPGNQL